MNNEPNSNLTALQAQLDVANMLLASMQGDDTAQPYHKLAALLQEEVRTARDILENTKGEETIELAKMRTESIIYVLGLTIPSCLNKHAEVIQELCNIIQADQS